MAGEFSRRGLMAGVQALAFAQAAAAQSPLLPPPEPTEIVPLWPGAAPGGQPPDLQENLVERSTAPNLHDRAITGVVRPTLAVFRPINPDRSAVLLIPGGSYTRVAIDKEGYDTARWLALRGVTAFVLVYRLPGEGWKAGADTSLQDAQRAMRVIRREAPRFALDPARVAVLGFSAGGHIAASLAQRFDAPVYAPVDAADALSARPDLNGLLYPVITMRAPYAHSQSREKLLGLKPTKARIAAYSLESHARAGAASTFLLHAYDDPSVPVENTLRFAAALRAAKIPLETHLFEEGGHGFGLRGAAGKPAAAWPDLFVAWGVRKGVFRGA